MQDFERPGEGRERRAQLVIDRGDKGRARRHQPLFGRDVLKHVIGDVIPMQMQLHHPALHRHTLVLGGGDLNAVNGDVFVHLRKGRDHAAQLLHGFDI